MTDLQQIEEALDQVLEDCKELDITFVAAIHDGKGLAKTWSVSKYLTDRLGILDYMSKLIFNEYLKISEKNHAKKIKELE